MYRKLNLDENEIDWIESDALNGLISLEELYLCWLRLNRGRNILTVIKLHLVRQVYSLVIIFSRV